MNVLEQYLNKQKNHNKINPFYKDIEELNYYYSIIVNSRLEKSKLLQEIKSKKTELENKIIFTNKSNWSKVINSVLNINNFSKQGIMFITNKGMRIRCNKFIISNLFHKTIEDNPEILKPLNQLQLDLYEKHKVVHQFNKNDSKYFYNHIESKHHELFFLKIEIKDKEKKILDLKNKILIFEKKLKLILKIKSSHFLDNVRYNYSSELFDNILNMDSNNLNEKLKQFNFIKDSLDGLSYFLKELGRVNIEYNLNQKTIGNNSVKIEITLQNVKDILFINEEELFLLIFCVGIINFKSFYPVQSRYYSNGLKLDKSKIIFENIMAHYIYN
jgi:hypothetical protein